MSKFEVGLEAPGIGSIRVVTRIIAIPHPDGYYNPQYQIVGATPEDTAKLCRIKDVQAFLDHSAPGTPTNAEALADALGGIAVSQGAVEGLPEGGQLNADDEKLGPQARRAITDTINRCKATLQERTPDMPSNDGRFTATEPFQSGVFGEAGVTPVAVRPNDPFSPSPPFVTRNVAAPRVYIFVARKRWPDGRRKRRRLVEECGSQVSQYQSIFGAWAFPSWHCAGWSEPTRASGRRTARIPGECHRHIANVCIARPRTGPPAPWQQRYYRLVERSCRQCRRGQPASWTWGTEASRAEQRAGAANAAAVRPRPAGNVAASRRLRSARRRFARQAPGIAAQSSG